MVSPHGWCPKYFEISILENAWFSKLTLIEKYVIHVSMFLFCDKNLQESLFNDSCLSPAPEFKYSMTKDLSSM